MNKVREMKRLRSLQEVQTQLVLMSGEKKKIEKLHGKAIETIHRLKGELIEKEAQIRKLTADAQAVTKEQQQTLETLQGEKSSLEEQLREATTLVKTSQAEERDSKSRLEEAKRTNKAYEEDRLLAVSVANAAQLVLSDAENAKEAAEQAGGAAAAAAAVAVREAAQKVALAVAAAAAAAAEAEAATAAKEAAEAAKEEKTVEVREAAEAAKAAREAAEAIQSEIKTLKAEMRTAVLTVKASGVLLTGARKRKVELLASAKEDRDNLTARLKEVMIELKATQDINEELSKGLNDHLKNLKRTNGIFAEALEDKNTSTYEDVAKEYDKKVAEEKVAEEPMVFGKAWSIYKRIHQPNYIGKTVTAFGKSLRKDLTKQRKKGKK